MGDQARESVRSTETAQPSTSGAAAAPAQGIPGWGRGNEAAQGRMLEGGGQCSAQCEDVLDAISDKYIQILMERGRGVEELRQDASVEDPPPGWVDVALAVGTVAIGAATAGIGSAVSGAVAATAAASYKVIISDAYREVMKVAVEQGIGTALEASLSAADSNPATNVTDAFFRAQSDALHKAGGKAQDTFNLDVRPFLRSAEDPVAAARALFDALDRGFAAAKTIQRQESLVSWCNFLARTQLGTTNEGTAKAGADLGEQVGDTSGKGVLGLVVEASSDGQMEVLDAEIEGLNETLRGELAGRTIGSVDIPITVKGQVNPPAWYEERAPDGLLRFGENEAGTKWNRSTRAGDAWLAGKVEDRAPDATGTAEISESSVWKGVARVLDDEIRPRSLRELGIALTDPHGYD